MEPSNHSNVFKYFSDLSVAAINDLNAQEVEEVRLALSNPSVQKWFKLLGSQAMQDFVGNDLTNFKQQEEVLAYHNKLQGMLSVLMQLINFSRR